MDVPGLQTAHGLEFQHGAAEQRNDLVIVLGLAHKFLLPVGLKLLARMVGHFPPQPSWACRKQLEAARVIGRSRRVTKVGRMDLVGVFVQCHLLRILQVDLAVDQVVFQPLRARLETDRRCVQRSGRTLGHNAGGLQIEPGRSVLCRAPACGAGRVK